MKPVNGSWILTDSFRSTAWPYPVHSESSEADIREAITLGIVSLVVGAEVGAEVVSLLLEVAEGCA